MAETQHKDAPKGDQPRAEQSRGTHDDKGHEAFVCAVDCVCNAVKKLTESGLGSNQAGEVAFKIYEKTHG